MADRRRSKGLSDRRVAGLVFAVVAAAMTAGMILYAARRRGRPPGPQGEPWPIPTGRIVPPAFRLPPGKRVLVFPDDMFDPVSHPSAKRALVEKVNETLAEKRATASAVQYDELRALAESEPQFSQWAVATVGRKLQADLVIYIALDPLTLKDTSADTLWHGRFAGRVRVVDVQRGRLWPAHAAGHRVEVIEPPTEDLSEGYDRQLARRLGETLGEKVAELFQDHFESLPPGD